MFKWSSLTTHDPHGLITLWQKGRALSRQTTREQTAVWVWQKLLFLQLCDSSEVKKGNPCPLNRGCRLKKGRATESEQAWVMMTPNMQGRKDSREKVKMALQALITCRGTCQLPWKRVMIIKKYYPMARFWSRFWHSAACQISRCTQIPTVSVKNLLHLYEIKNVSLLCSTRLSKQKTTVSLYPC